MSQQHAAGDMDQIMAQASDALSRMAYLRCERLCLEALRIARQREDWPYYARILMPLQECRRQRRMIAADTAVRLGSTDLSGDPAHWLDRFHAGCIVLTQPHTPDDARTLEQAAQQQQRHVEVLYCDHATDASCWVIRSLEQPDIHCQRPAPPESWRNQRYDANAMPVRTLSTQQAIDRVPATPMDWFLDASEALGDAAIATVHQPPGSIDRVIAFERLQTVVSDHELLHQHLHEAVKAMLHGRGANEKT